MSSAAPDRACESRAARRRPVEDRAVALGRVVGAHGVRGGLRVRFFGDGPDTLLRVTEVDLAAHEDAPVRERREVVGAAPGRPGEVRLALAGIDDREAALTQRGLLVVGRSADLEPLGEDDFYWYELVGCRVETREGRLVGRVRELWDVGPHDLLVVEGEDGRERLVPTVRALLPEIDVEERRVVVEDLPGLLEPS